MATAAADTVTRSPSRRWSIRSTSAAPSSTATIPGTSRSAACAPRRRSISASIASSAPIGRSPPTSRSSRSNRCPNLYSSEAGGITIADFLPETDVTHADVHRDGPAQAYRPAPHRRPRLHPQRDAADDRAISATRTAEILDSLPWGEKFDWVDTVSIELTTQMLAILFDFPWEDRRKLTFWSDWAGDIELVKNEELRLQRLQHMYECGAYFKNLWDQKVDKEPTPDLISMMIHSDAMREMDHMEFIGNLILLIVGGNDTTRNSMTALCLRPRPVSRRARQAGGRSRPDPQRGAGDHPLADPARPYAPHRDRRHRADGPADQGGRQARALVHLGQSRRERVRRGCRQDRRRPRQCAAPPGLWPRHPPLRRRAAGRTADRGAAGGNGQAPDAGERRRRARRASPPASSTATASCR